MADGFAELDGMIARLRALPKLAQAAAPDIARAVQSELERTIAAGTTPEGKPWTAKKDGSKPLVNAAKAITVVAVDKTVIVKLKGPEALHHLRRARGGVERQVIPTKRIPAPMATAIRNVLAQHFTAAVSNG